MEETLVKKILFPFSGQFCTIISCALQRWVHLVSWIMQAAVALNKILYHVALSDLSFVCSSFCFFVGAICLAMCWAIQRLQRSDSPGLQYSLNHLWIILITWAIWRIVMLTGLKCGFSLGGFHFSFVHSWLTFSFFFFFSPNFAGSSQRHDLFGRIQAGAGDTRPPEDQELLCPHSKWRSVHLRFACFHYEGTGCHVTQASHLLWLGSFCTSVLWDVMVVVCCHRCLWSKQDLLLFGRDLGWHGWLDQHHRAGLAADQEDLKGLFPSPFSSSERGCSLSYYFFLLPSPACDEEVHHSWMFGGSWDSGERQPSPSPLAGSQQWNSRHPQICWWARLVLRLVFHTWKNPECALWVWLHPAHNVWLPVCRTRKGATSALLHDGVCYSDHAVVTCVSLSSLLCEIAFHFFHPFFSSSSSSSSLWDLPSNDPGRCHDTRVA